MLQESGLFARTIIDPASTLQLSSAAARGLMSRYQRTTRECTLAELRPELVEAIRAYAQHQQWSNLDAEVVACCETTTEQSSTNRLEAWLNGGAAISHRALIATPDRLIWAHSSDRAPAGAASAQYKDMRLKIFTPKRSASLAVEIYARMDGTRKKTGGRFMLDGSPAAHNFCEAVMRATDRLYPPEVKKPRRKWFGK
jgi:hypothetical protein